MSTILIVDDVSANRDVLVTLLNPEGHTLIEASDGDEALQAVRTAQPDLVITDVLMPVMDGFEFVRQLRLEPDRASTPVIFYTANYGHLEARALAAAGGVTDVLTKPIHGPDALRVVRRALSIDAASDERLHVALTPEFDREHLRLVTDKLSEKTSDLRTSNARLRALINIGLELASERDHGRLLERVCLAVCDLFGASSVALGTVAPDTLTVERVVTAGASEASQWIKPGDVLSGVLGAVVAERKTIRADTASADPNKVPFPTRHPNVQTFLAGPIASPSRTYGWICLSAHAGRVFTDNDEALVHALSGLVGRIYENGQLVAAAEERADALSREMAERRQTENALRASDRLNRNLVEHLPHRIVVKDRQSVVLFCNANYAQDIGLAPADIVGKPTSEFYPAALAEAYTADDRAVMESGLTKTLEEPQEVAGRERWVHTVKVPYRDEEGAIIGVLVLFEDVTERRALETKSQQSQKMEVVGRLAAGVAHDFNNVLTVILGMCELLLTDIDEKDLAHRADITEIRTAGERAAALTRQLLAFSRKQIIEPTVVDLNLIVVEMLAMIVRLTQAHVAVVPNLRPGSVFVKADRGQLEQVILNLAVNARDAMPNGGTLTIATSIDLDARDASRHATALSGAYVALTISDTGDGMTEETQRRLFEPFFTTKAQGKGTGLGLATVQGIVAQSGGSVGVSSELGTGTTFTVYLPRLDGWDVGDPRQLGASSQRPASTTVLVVDDQAEIRDLAKRLLERHGYSVLTAANGEEASRRFEQHATIDLLLTDVIMPGANGAERTRQLLASHPKVKVVYMSGYSEDTIASHGVLNAGVALLQKPFTSESLGRKIREVLGR